MGAACARRRPQQLAEGETPFWEEIEKAKASTAGQHSPEAATEETQAEEVQQDEKDEVELPGYEQANHLKEQGKDKFARGELDEATACWLQALESLPPSSAAPKGLLGLLPRKEEEEEEDHRIRELRVALLSNLALASSRQKKFRPAVNFCEEVLLEEPGNVKALYRKADALGELCDWHEAEEAADQLQQKGGEEGAKLAQQKRDEWKRRQRQADDQQKKMWSAALEKEKAAEKAEKAEKAEADAKAKPKEAKPKVALEAWMPSKVEAMSPFDLRKKMIEWQEEDHFSDKIWKESLGRKEASFYQKRALPLSLLAGCALAEMELPKLSDLVVHCILDGNLAPFSDPHDWSIFLKRCPEVRSMLVIYIDIGAVALDKDGRPPPTYGMLLPPSEEGRCGDRVARAARFMGTYQEFKKHCRDLPGLVRPHVALWADVPLYGFHDEDFSIRLQALSQLREEGISMVFTFGHEVPGLPGGPALKLEDVAKESMAILALSGLGLRKLTAWHWNRFVVPLDRGPHGILAGHALLSVWKPGKTAEGSAAPTVSVVKEALKRRGVALTAVKPPGPPKQFDQKFVEMRDKQWQAFCQHLQMQGRVPAGPGANEEEKRRQMIEWRQFVGGE